MIRFGMLRCSDSPTQIVDPIGDENTEDGLPAEVRQHKWETPGPARQRCRRPARERHENPRGGTVSRTLVAQRLMPVGLRCGCRYQRQRHRHRHPAGWYLLRLPRKSWPTRPRCYHGYNYDSEFKTSGRCDILYQGRCPSQPTSFSTVIKRRL
jgi:hypothetical protein